MEGPGSLRNDMFQAYSFASDDEWGDDDMDMGMGSDEEEEDEEQEDVDDDMDMGLDDEGGNEW
jgi:hypothetical protein